MFVILAAIAAIIVLILMGVRTKKEEHVVYNKLDKAGKVTNIILLIAYALSAPAYMFIGMISEPAKEGLMGLAGWIVAIFISSAVLFCGLGIGASVSLRKKGRSKLSFAVQFVGVAAIGLAFLLYAIFEGNLLRTLN